MYPGQYSSTGPSAPPRQTSQSQYYSQQQQQSFQGQGQGIYKNNGGGPPPPPYQARPPRKKALLVGINYRGQRSELKGCINDVENMKYFISTNYGFSTDSESMLVLREDATLPPLWPTKNNIMAACQWLVAGAQAGDSLFFHYSGHGGQKKDLDGDEEDGYDETIYPIDHQQQGVIIDDHLHLALVRPLPPGCRLTAIFDCCHSGTVLDLPYIYNTQGQLKVANVAKEAAQQALSSAMRGNLIGGVFSSINTLVSSGRGNNEALKARNTAMGDVIMLSGCKDTQTSIDTNMSGRGNTGAMSFALISTLLKNRQQTYLQLLQSMRNELAQSNMEQLPQLSTGREMDLNTWFTM